MRFWSFLIGALFLAALSPTLDAYERVYAFGDSLSDNGNTPAVTFDQRPGPEPYWNSRFSNGPVWTEALATAVGTNFNNYAYGGGQADGGVTGYLGGFVTIPNTGFAGSGAGSQYDLFLGDLGPTYDLSDDLFLIGGGAVNYLTEGETTAAPVDDLRQLIEDLYNLGAREFMISNLPDLGTTPDGLDDADGGPAGADLTSYTMAFNTELLLQMDELAADEGFDGITLYHLDLYTFLNDVIDDPVTYGFTDVTAAANTVAGAPLISGYLPDGSPDPSAAGIAARDFWDDYLFFDSAHPTAMGHALLGDIAIGLVSVPEPSVHVGLLLGVGWVLMIRKRGRGNNHTTTANS